MTIDWAKQYRFGSTKGQEQQSLPIESLSELSLLIILGRDAHNYDQYNTFNLNRDNQYNFLPYFPEDMSMMNKEECLLKQTNEKHSIN